ncbi:hypothetical protein [Actinomadura sp. 3N508]|uniref:hypothetical protein n=1 Tax=Actinomadura sp. 3N508 TaxID=3375153 RepID=UPI003797B52C
MDGPALPLRELERRLEVRKWACELVRDGDDTVLRVSAPDAGDDPKRTVEVVVRDRGRGPYFAYLRTPDRLLATIEDLDRAVAALDLVHGSKPPPPPPVPEGLARAAAETAAEWADGTATGDASP